MCGVVCVHFFLLFSLYLSMCIEFYIEKHFSLQKITLHIFLDFMESPSKEI